MHISAKILDKKQVKVVMLLSHLHGWRPRCLSGEVLDGLCLGSKFPEKEKHVEILATVPTPLPSEVCLLLRAANSQADVLLRLLPLTSFTKPKGHGYNGENECLP